MSNNLSAGPIEVLDNEVSSINQALAVVLERLDGLQGLRGRVVIRDRIRADDPVDDDDVMTKRVLTEQAQDAIGIILADTDTLNLTYNDVTPAITGDVLLQMSLTSDASGVKLVSDAATPGNWKFYGTEGTGTKGFQTPDHGNLAGLADDDHTQYYLANGTRALNGPLNHDGTTIGLNTAAPVAQSTGWTVTNLTPNKTLDTTAATLQNVRDILGTLLTYLLLRGDLGA